MKKNFFKIYGYELVLSEEDKEFGNFYWKSTDVGTEKLNEFKEHCIEVANVISEKNANEKISELAIYLLSIQSAMFGVFWNYLIEHRIYTLDRNDLYQYLKKKWFCSLGNMEGFKLAEYYNSLWYRKVDYNKMEVYQWLLLIRKDKNIIEKVCDEIGLKNMAHLCIDVVDVINKNRVMEKKYDFPKFLTISGNIEKAGISERNIGDYIENLTTFPCYPYSYFELIKRFGDQKKEIEKVMQYLGMKEIVASYKIVLLGETIPENMRGKAWTDLSEEQLFQMDKIIREAGNYYGVDDSENSYLGDIKKRLEEIDKAERTVNGILYENRDQARDVRNRSFDGKEYKSVQHANLVKEEVLEIRKYLEGTTALEKYQAKEKFDKYNWRTQEAIAELKKLSDQIEYECQEMRKKSKGIPKVKRVLKRNILIGLLASSAALAINIIFGIILLVIAGIIVLNTYLELKECKQAESDYQQIKKEYEKKARLLHNGSFDSIRCSICGEKIPNDVLYCPFCGEEVK
ncbi:MAG: hypothetical protein MRZ74_12915 [Blautia sp.]|nr:hypothetical protein [Blautia sp.]